MPTCTEDGVRSGRFVTRSTYASVVAPASSLPKSVLVQAPGLIVLGDGRDAKTENEARGRVFEDFFARLLSLYGFVDPRREYLRVRQDGIEIDIRARHRLTQRTAIAELKAYSAPVPVGHLKQFAGTFAAEADDNVDAFFVATPHLSAEGVEFARRLEKKYENFKYLGASDVVALLQERELLPSPSDTDQHADLTAVITPHGLALAARLLDPTTRRPIAISCWTLDGQPSQALLELLGRSQFAAGLPVEAPGRASTAIALPPASEAPSVVSVRGSTDDFEYQVPASPQYFVGRESVLTDLLQGFSHTERRGEVVVINAQSGWGKSSLALKLAGAIEEVGGAALVVDTRTAEDPSFVVAALEAAAHRAEEAGLLRLSANATFTSASTALESLGAAKWLQRESRLLVFFDQFENIFRSQELTRHFRDLALQVREVRVPLVVGFAWKTDLVGWTEDHPYALRDDIRDVARNVVLEPFTAKEVRTLLRRLERRLATPLHAELRKRLGEYSQGLPWLLKKLLGHVLDQVERQGVSQDVLLAQDLNVSTLFANDLAVLTPPEETALRHIARSAPVPVIELEGVVPQEVLGVLIHRRLVVQVGARIDVYWDIFRDFLISGRVAIEDSFVMRYGPTSVGRLLRTALDQGGDMSVAEAGDVLATSSTVVLNLSRELRLLRLARESPGRVVLDPKLVTADDREQLARTTVARAMRRHKVFGLVTTLVEKHGGRVTMQQLAAELPSAFPAVEAKPKSWGSYARCYVQWLDYAGLVIQERDGRIRLPREDERRERVVGLTVKNPGPARLKRVFPGASAGPAMHLLRRLAGQPLPPLSANASSAAARDLGALGLVERPDVGSTLRLTDRSIITDSGDVDDARLRRLVEDQPGCRAALEALDRDPELEPHAVGAILREAYGAGWRDQTTKGVGKAMRSWARRCGVRTQARSLPQEPTVDHPTLFE